MEGNPALYIRAVFNNQKRWVKVNTESVDVTEAINRAVAHRFEIPADKNILYYDEAHYQIDNDLLKDFIWFNPRGVILNIKLEGEDLHFNSLPSTPRSNISVASTSTNFSGSSDVPQSLICERSLSPKPEGHKHMLSYSFNEQVSLPLAEGLSKGRTIQPYLLAVGSCKQVIVDYYIILDGVLIPCESKTALGAFDELFQSYFVFKTKFDDHLRSFWTYIQTEVYSLITNEHVTLTPREREIQIKINNVQVD